VFVRVHVREKKIWGSERNEEGKIKRDKEEETERQCA